MLKLITYVKVGIALNLVGLLVGDILSSHVFAIVQMFICIQPKGACEISVLVIIK